MAVSSARRARFSVILALLLGMGLLYGLAQRLPVQAVSTSIAISQVYGGGGNAGATYRQDFIELHNVSAVPVSVTGWSVQYAATTGTNWAKTDLAGTIPPGGYLLVQESQGAGGTLDVGGDIVGTIAMASGAGKVALLSTSTLIATGTACPSGAGVIDIVGYGAGTTCSEGAPTGTLSNTTAALRAGNGCQDTDSNSGDFAVAAPTPRNSSTTAVLCPTGTPTPSPTASPSPSPSASPGVTPTPSPSPSASPGVTPTPSPSPSSSPTASPTASPTSTPTPTPTPTPSPTPSATPIPIGTVQGAVPDSADGATHRSSFAPASGNGTGQTVTVQGVITQLTQTRTSTGGIQYGFFLQNTTATADSDPNTSDGIFVFQSTFTTLRRDPSDTYTPQVGDEVVLRGPVVEFFFLTELSNPFVLNVVRSGVNLDQEVPAFDVNPPADLAAAARYWERREGMRGRLPAGSIVTGARDVFASTLDAEVWVIRADAPVAQRSDPYTRRVFRDPHPLDNNTGQLFDDGNGYRILLGSLGIKAALNDSTALIAPARDFDTLGAVTGAVYFAFDKYSIQPNAQISPTAGSDPALNAPPQTPDPAREYSIATFNVENLYDFRDDPFDGCDFTGNAGCPGVTPPFDYVPASDAVYRTRLGQLAQQIVQDLKAPDLILVQEAEDQDICTVTGTQLTCGTTNNADGKPDTLQELALAVQAANGPRYDAAYDRNGADARGITAAFLYRTDRVELLPVPSSDPLLGATPTVQYRGAPLASNSDVQNPKTLNAVLPADVDRSTGVDGSNVYTRAPQVGLFRIRSSGGSSVDLYAISNHFSSTPDERVGQRREQAAYNAALVAALQGANPNVRVVTGGDFNVFPRPDDPFAPGQPGFPSDQLAPLYTQGLLSLWEVLAQDVPAAAYSYVFEGQAQTLDQLFVTPSVRSTLAQIRVAHINADYPADFAGDGPRGLSDHDPGVARFRFPDSTPPTTTATSSPAANAAGWWNAAEVRVTLTATDNPGGEGVREIVTSLGGAQSGGTTTPGATATVSVTAEGTTTLTYFARDNAGNAETPKTLTIRIDRTAPALTCAASPAELWPPNGQQVPITVTVTATDGGSGGTSYTLTSATSSDDTGGEGNGSRIGEDIAGWEIGTPDVSGTLRAERQGNTPRVYTLSYSASDAAGNTATCQTMVTVPANQGR